MRSSTKVRADVNPTRHSYRIGVGYFEHDDVPVTPTDRRAPPCEPPDGTAPNMSHHILLSTGGAEVRMVWLADHRCWRNLTIFSGHRMAWSPHYLGAHGWSYARPVR